MTSPTSIKITRKDLQGSPKQVGTLDGKPVFHYATKGGWNMVVVKKGSSEETLGCGSHKAVAIAIAERNPNLKLDSLAKSEQMPKAYYEDLLPRWEAITKRIQELERSK